MTSCDVRSLRRGRRHRATPRALARARRAASAPRARRRRRSALRAPARLQTVIGSALPFASTGSASAKSTMCLVARYVVWSTMTPLTGAALCRRAAVLTTSPDAIPSPASGRAPSETSASPVVIPTRTSRPSSSAKSRIARAARTARSGSSSWAVGAPKSAITASPMNFSTVPPWPRARRGRARGTGRGWPDVLGIELLGPRGEADEVAEDDRDDLALPRTRRGGTLRGSPRLGLESMT